MDLKNLLSKILKTLEHYPFDKEMLLLPVDTSSISREQLNFLIDNELIQKFNNPKHGWCGGCNTVCDIEYKDDKKYFICWECRGHETINNTNLIKYSTSITALISFLQNILELNKENEVIVDNKLLYIGSKGIEKYYFFHKICQSHSNDLIKDYIKYSDSFILTLENNHTIQIRIFNILEYLVFEESKCILALPKIKYINSIASLGGQKKAERYSEARNFIIKEFEIISSTGEKMYKYKKCEIIADKLRQQPKLIQGLEDSNLEDFVRKTVSKAYLKTY